MKKLIGACGLVCNDCLAFKATLTNNDQLRDTTAQFWSTIYGTPHTKDDINCQGCMAEGAKYAHCNECEYRLCAIERGLNNCSECKDYPCEKLSRFHEDLPMARLVLDEEREKRKA